MLTGYNTDFKFQGEIYHCQTEDGGAGSPSITSLMYHKGAILASRKTSYADIIKADCLTDVVRELMMEQHKQMIRDLMQGKLALNANAAQTSAAAPAPAAASAPAAQESSPPPPPVVAAPPVIQKKQEEIKEKSLDDIILEFLEEESKTDRK